MQLSTPWIIFIVIVIFAIIISNITLLKRSNKAFTFPDSYEKSNKDEVLNEVKETKVKPTSQVKEQDNNTD